MSSRGKKKRKAAQKQVTKKTDARKANPSEELALFSLILSALYDENNPINKYTFKEN